MAVITGEPIRYADTHIIYLWQVVQRLATELNFTVWTDDRGINLRSEAPGMLPDNILFTSSNIVSVHAFLLAWQASRTYLLIEQRAKRRAKR